MSAAAGTESLARARIILPPATPPPPPPERPATETTAATATPPDASRARGASPCAPVAAAAASVSTIAAPPHASLAAPPPPPPPPSPPPPPPPPPSPPPPPQPAPPRCGGGAPGVAHAASDGDPSAPAPAPAPAPARVFCVEDDAHLTPAQHMAAGALAGVTEHVAMFPVDTIKTRMQSYSAAAPAPPHAAGMLAATRALVSAGGLPALWRGVSAVALSAGPAHALYFAMYEAVRLRLAPPSGAAGTASGGGGGGGGALATAGVTRDVAAAAAAGVCGTLVADGIMTPLDVVKQRMQLTAGATAGAGAHGGTVYRSAAHCLRRVYVEHGLRAFFAGYKPTVLMNVPFNAMYVAGYESAKLGILSWRGISNDMHFSPSSHCLAGALGGAMAAAVTNPLDVVKTRLQTQGEVGARRYRGMSHALSCIAREEGWPGLMRGLRPRVLFHMPAAAVCWTTYEFCKHVLRRTGRYRHDDDALV